MKYEEDLIKRIDRLVISQEQSLDANQFEDEETIFENIYKLEIERVKYMLKSYLRARLGKVNRLDILTRLDSEILHVPYPRR